MLLLLLACAGAPTDDSGATCTLLEAGDRLDLAAGCVDGLCGGTTYPDAVAVLGEPDACTADASEATCQWGDVSATFPDCDHDGAPDTESVCDLFGQELSVAGGWDGASAEGLGLGVDASCFEQELGPPGAAGWEFGANPWVVVSISPASGAVGQLWLDWSFEE